MHPVRWVRRIRNLAVAPAAHRRVVLAAVALTPRVGWRLRRRGYQATRAWLETRPVPPADTTALARADRAIRALPWRPRCLERSLVVWRLAGAGAQLRLGVSREGRQFHAWVERDGIVLNDTADVATRYLPFDGTGVDPDRFD